MHDARIFVIVPARSACHVLDFSKGDLVIRHGAQSASDQSAALGAGIGLLVAETIGTLVTDDGLVSGAARFRSGPHRYATIAPACPLSASTGN